jgi:hypothetical protein
MPRKTASKPLGVRVTQYEADASDSCNFRVESMDGGCGEKAVTALIVTDAQGRGVLLKMCRRHLCRLSILLIEELE